MQIAWPRFGGLPYVQCKWNGRAAPPPSSLRLCRRSLTLRDFLEMGDRFVHSSLLEQSVAEVVVGIRVVGIDFQRLLEMGDRFVHASLLDKSVAEVVVGVRVVGIDL